jgi:hypothetical protein
MISKQKATKNKSSSRGINVSGEDRTVIPFPTLFGSYSNHQNIYESKRQNNPRKEVWIKMEKFWGTRNSPFQPRKRFEGVQLTTIDEAETSTS